MIYHIYKGSISLSTDCEKCGESAFNVQHVKNGDGTPCDVLNGPCGCGAWHSNRNKEIDAMNRDLMDKAINPDFGSTLEEKLLINRLFRVNSDGTWK